MVVLYKIKSKMKEMNDRSAFDKKDFEKANKTIRKLRFTILTFFMLTIYSILWDQVAKYRSDEI